MSKWQTVPLGDLCDHVQYGVTASALPDVNDGPRLLRITDIVPSSINWASVPRCDVSADKIKKFELREGDIVVARTGATVGYAKQIKSLPAQTLFASYLVRFQVSENADPKFVGHIVQSASFKEYVATHAGGAAQPNANAKLLSSFPVPLPEIRLQRRIAAILSAFDELIEINERRIQLLEDLAQSLYREWFVQFRGPGYEHVALVDSEVGPIPDGWMMRRLGDVAEFTGGNSLTKASYVPHGFCAFSAAGPDGFLPSFEVDGKGVVLSAVGARSGRTFRAHGRWSAIANTIRILPRSGLCQPSWLYLVTADPTIWPKRGSAQPFISINDARGVRVLVPPYRLSTEFEEIIGGVFKSVDTLSELSRELTATRDLLLPRLLTGKLDISDIDLGVLTPTETE